MEIESGSIDMLEDLDFPVGDPTFARPYIHNDDAVIELVNPGRSLTEALQLALGVDIEHEKPAYRQMATRGCEERNPRVERDKVIESVEDTDHNVELFSERERRDISLYKTSIWNADPSQREHPSRQIQSRDGRHRRDPGQDRPRSTSKFEEGG